MPRIGAPLAVEVSDVYFLHWPVPVATVEAVVPDGLTVDVADGSAWVSAVLLGETRWESLGIGLRAGGAAANVRTYVRTPDDQRAVYFLSIDATDRLAVEAGRGLFRLPYHHAAITRDRAGERTVIEAARLPERRPRLAATVAPRGEPTEPAPDTLAAFLTERYRYVTDGPLGTLLCGSVGHDPWRLGPADVEVAATGLLEAAGIGSVDGEPIAHHSPGTDMTIDPPRPAFASASDGG